MKKIITILSLFGMFSSVQAADVSIYQHCNFQGYRIDLPQGNLDMNNLLRRGMKNDDISSIRVKPGATVILYQHAGFQGDTRTIRGNVSCLVDQNFNDTVSSIVVRGKSNNSASGVNGRSVKTAIFSGGRFVETQPRRWTEFGNDRQAKFSFIEIGRDDWSVYLNDNSRNVQIQIDLHRKMIGYGENNGAKRDLYRITSSSKKRLAPNLVKELKPVVLSLEQQCFNMVQNRVSYNRSGSKRWDPKNVKNLCRNTRNPSRTVSCFKSGIRNHGSWKKSVNDCRGGASVSKASVPKQAPVRPTTTNNSSGLRTINAGPIWNQADANNKCPKIAKRNNSVWTGQWWTTVQGKMSVCQVKSVQTRTVNAGPIWNQADANIKCPQIAQQNGGKWTGQWWTTVQGKMSVCQIQ